jgi:hypothetical protein
MGGKLSLADYGGFPDEPSLPKVEATFPTHDLTGFG